MPGIGSNYSAMPGNYELPEKYQGSLSLGIRFFVIRHPKRCRFDRQFWGPFDVEASDNVDDFGQSQREVKWLTGRNAGVKFYHQGGPKSLVGVAFFPDDKFYHNRTLLALEGHRWMIIEGMYTPTQGFIGGPRVNMEIDCLREVLYCDTEIWKVMDPRRGRERDYFMTKREAEAFITSKKMVMRGKGGLVPFDMQPNLHCVVEQGTKLMLRPEILSIIRSHQRDQYGWTGCDEYKKVVVSKMNALIAKRGDAEDSRPQVQAGVENQVLEILSRLDLTPDQLAKLKSTKRPEAPVAQVDTGASGDIDPDDIPPASEDVDDDPNPTVQDHTQVREAAVTYTSADLWKKKNDDLKAIATGLGISTEDFVRKEAVESILNIQGTPAQAETVLN